MSAGQGEKVGSPTGRRILALDGGGVRGVIAIAFLERIEALVVERGGRRLADFFDLIGGTSTGAIIATTLALGLSVAEVKAMYFDLAPKVFKRHRFRVALWSTLFDSAALKAEIAKVVGDRHLDTGDLRTALVIIAKRLDTGGAWIVSNNPRSRYWEDDPNGAHIGNRHYALADLVRASTAAPYFFQPQEIVIAAGQEPGLFVDGGITPHNNPALALLQVATIPAYGFAWPSGADRLRLISIGTGAWRDRMTRAEARRAPAAQLGVSALASMVADSSTQVLTMLHMLGRTDIPWRINSEIGDLDGFNLAPQPLFTFERYDVWLEPAWLKRELGLSLGLDEIYAVSRMDNCDAIPLAYEIGQAAAAKYVKAEHLGLT